MPMVTGRELDLKTVTIDAPFGDLLARAGAALARWQEDLAHLNADLERLHAEGIILDERALPVLPTWWERPDRASSHYLVWPAEHARRAGIPRRQRIEESEYEVMEAKRRRTVEYVNVLDRRNRLAARIAAAGQDLEKLAERYEW